MKDTLLEGRCVLPSGLRTSLCFGEEIFADVKRTQFCWALTEMSKEIGLVKTFLSFIQQLFANVLTEKSKDIFLVKAFLPDHKFVQLLQTTTIKL